jgi:hypothetical protein
METTMTITWDTLAAGFARHGLWDTAQAVRDHYEGDLAGAAEALAREDREAEAAEAEQARRDSWWSHVEACREAIEAAGFSVDRERQAQTGTIYLTISDAEGVESTVRVADHGDAHCRAEISVVHVSPTPDDTDLSGLVRWLAAKASKAADAE